MLYCNYITNKDFNYTIKTTFSIIEKKYFQLFTKKQGLNELFKISISENYLNIR